MDKPAQRISVGIWTEWYAGARWANEGMTRLLGYIIEGAAKTGRYTFKIIMVDALREEVIQDMSTLNAKYGVDYTIECPKNIEISNDFKKLAKYANEKIKVEGWIVLYPQFEHALLLDKTVSVIFPDAIPVAYPTADVGAWGPNGYHLRWKDAVGRLLKGADKVICFSEHVAEQHGQRIYGVPREKIAVIDHAPPNLSALVDLSPNSQRTENSRMASAHVLRKHCEERGWSEWADFPFEEVDYIAVSTQDRVTKNIRLITEALQRLNRGKRTNIKLIMTAPIHYGASWTPLPGYLEQEMLMSDVMSMTDLPRDVHAAFYHCALASVHSSIFEGGRGVFPFYEGVSVGTPCLMGDGPHVREFVELNQELAPYVFDSNDADTLSDLILQCLNDRPSVFATQKKVFQRLSKRTWQDVANEYVGTIAL